MDTNIIALQREINELRKRIGELSTHESQPPILDNYLNLFMLRGLWNFGSVDYAGGARDISGNGMHLSSNGGVPYSFFEPAGFPFAYLNGSSQWEHRSHETHLNLGQSFCFGGWFYVNSYSVNNQGLIGKYLATGNQRSYALILLGSGASPANTIRFVASSDGAATTNLDAGITLPVGNGIWHFIAGRFNASTEMALFIDGVKYTNTTSIPASVYGNTAPFEIGRYDGGNYLNGGVTLCFITGWWFSDSHINHLFQSSRWAFGV